MSSTEKGKLLSKKILEDAGESNHLNYNREDDHLGLAISDVEGQGSILRNFKNKRLIEFHKDDSKFDDFIKSLAVLESIVT